ncbi:hypothetical protein [Yinghuangia soli]|uniref:Uncharacterized protein n=1 Tax=Yinghuangia soli TaxID=2908204 RepID=A0AA41PVX1_9ACTN|nr:hypothetical protein [Yinghuangia soli]MCF2526713.1 hypothetical protein [Yinghuangia soli]
MTEPTLPQSDMAGRGGPGTDYEAGAAHTGADLVFGQPLGEPVLVRPADQRNWDVEAVFGLSGGTAAAPSQAVELAAAQRVAVSLTGDHLTGFVSQAGAALPVNRHIALAVAVVRAVAIRLDDDVARRMFAGTLRQAAYVPED